MIGGILDLRKLEKTNFENVRKDSVLTYAGVARLMEHQMESKKDVSMVHYLTVMTEFQPLYSLYPPPRADCFFDRGPFRSSIPSPTRSFSSVVSDNLN